MMITDEQRKAALDALDEWVISRSTWNEDIEQKKANVMVPLLRTALQTPRVPVIDADRIMLNNILGILNNWIFLENGMDPYTKPDLIDETNKAIKVLETVLGDNVYYWRAKNDSTTH